MKTFEELFHEIVGSDELKKAYETAVRSGDEAVEAFLKENGCNATVADVKNYFKEQQEARELTADEIAGVAGGQLRPIKTDGPLDNNLSCALPWTCNPNYSASDLWGTVCA